MSNESSTAHSAAIQAITDARQNTRRYVYRMEQHNELEWDAIFIPDQNPEHPQRRAHAAVLDFHEQVNQAEYIIKIDNIWQTPLKNEAGHALEITVPKNDTIAIDTATSTPGEITPSLEDVETRTETVSLETLRYKWSGRYVTLDVTEHSPYRGTQTYSLKQRMWLPPKVIVAAYSRLNDGLSNMMLLAKTDAPIEHDPEPI